MTDSARPSALVALLVIDMLEDFLRGPFAAPGAQRLITRVKRVLDGARAQNLPVLYVCDLHLPTDKEFTIMGPHAIEGSAGAEIVTELAPRSGEQVVTKRRYSGFFSTDLDERLRETGAQTLVLCGVQTDCCVLHTAADAFFRDFGLVVLDDATSARTADGHLRALEHMNRLYGAEISTADCFLSNYQQRVSRG